MTTLTKLDRSNRLLDKKLGELTILLIKAVKFLISTDVQKPVRDVLKAMDKKAFIEIATDRQGALYFMFADADFNSLGTVKLNKAFSYSDAPFGKTAVEHQPFFVLLANDDKPMFKLYTPYDVTFINGESEEELDTFNKLRGKATRVFNDAEHLYNLIGAIV